MMRLVVHSPDSSEPTYVANVDKNNVQREFLSVT